MRKLWITLGILAIVLLIAFIALQMYTKSFSPEETAELESGDLQVSVTYCRPFASGRTVFGELVPYGEVWRTGANEATVFRSNQDLRVNNEILPAGEYSLFTVPNPENWEIIFNSATGQWGVSVIRGGAANRKSDNDVLVTEVPAINTDEYFEQFTVSLEGMKDEVDMILMWENTMVVIPMNKINP